MGAARLCAIPAWPRKPLERNQRTAHRVQHQVRGARQINLSHPLHLLVVADTTSLHSLSSPQVNDTPTLPVASASNRCDVG